MANFCDLYTKIQSNPENDKEATLANSELIFANFD